MTESLMTRHAITIEINDAALPGYTDEFLAMCWHAAQHNPAEFGDAMAGDLTEHIGREVIRRWLKGVQPELWHHQGRYQAEKWLSEFATYRPGPGRGPPRRAVVPGVPEEPAAISTPARSRPTSNGAPGTPGGHALGNAARTRPRQERAPGPRLQHLP